MGKVVLIAFALIVLVVAAAAIAQHLRYANLRRNVVLDRQPFLYGSATLHVVTLVEPHPGQDLIQDLRGFKDAVEATGAGQVIYVGKAAVRALRSTQLPSADWEAAVLAQYPSRAAYDAFVQTGAYKDGLGAFARTYSQGMDRRVAFNLGFPQFLLGIRVVDWFRGNTDRYPFTPRAGGENRLNLEQLRSHTELGADAIVVVNFIKNGSREQREANGSYGMTMLSLMGELAYGPMHMGRAVPVEGDTDFDMVALVFYPGVDFAADLFGSTFFGDIIGGKQLADSEALITVPLLGKL